MTELQPTSSYSKGMMTVSRADMTCSKMVRESLLTHGNLDIEDIRFASHVICGSKLTDEQLAAFLLHTSKETNIGRFALTYNYQLDRCIKDRDTDMVYGLAITPMEKAFIELSYNEELTPMEKHTITKMYNREYTAVINAMHFANKSHRSPEESGILPCEYMRKEENLKNSRRDKYPDNRSVSGDCSETTKISKETSGLKTTLYDRCYQGVCIFEAKQEDRDVMPGSASSKIPDKVYIPEKSEGQEVHRVYCFDIMQLIVAVSKDTPLNPVTGLPFTADALSLIYDKYSKEIKLYRHHLNKLRLSGLEPEV